jgi:hypothetical protein
VYFDDRSLVEKHGKKALARVDARFSSGGRVRQFLAVYERVTAHAGAAAVTVDVSE